MKSELKHQIGERDEMKDLLITLIFAYLMLCLLLFVMQRKFIYFPQGIDPHAPLSQAQSISLELEHIHLNGWQVNPGREKALVYYGGNAENIEYNIEFFKKLLPHYSVYLIPYRGYGGNEGAPSEKNLYRDALAVFDKLAKKHQDISLMGRSLGSAVALHVASNRTIEKLILVTPFDSVENVAKSIYWMFPVGLLLRDKFQTVDNLQHVTSPILLLIAEQDRVIPRVRTEHLINAADKQDLQAVVISGADHNDISFYNDYALSISRFMDIKLWAMNRR